MTNDYTKFTMAPITDNGITREAVEQYKDTDKWDDFFTVVKLAIEKHPDDYLNGSNFDKVLYDNLLHTSKYGIVHAVLSHVEDGVYRLQVSNGKKLLVNRARIHLVNNKERIQYNYRKDGTLYWQAVSGSVANYLYREIMDEIYHQCFKELEQYMHGKRVPNISPLTMGFIRVLNEKVFTHGVGTNNGGFTKQEVAHYLNFLKFDHSEDIYHGSDGVYELAVERTMFYDKDSARACYTFSMHEGYYRYAQSMVERSEDGIKVEVEQVRKEDGTTKTFQQYYIYDRPQMLMQRAMYFRDMIEYGNDAV